ncbi:MAG: DUF6498-containing protein, partial [Planctomycetota bacterium]
MAVFKEEKYLPARNWLTLPVAALIIANVIPIWGVLYFGWDAFYIVLLYWAENLAVGFYNVLKMALVRQSNVIGHIAKVFPIVFFMVHYGGFTAIHGFFVLQLFQNGEELEFFGKETWPCFFVFLQMLFNVIRATYSIIPTNMKYAILALFVSHGISFGYNYIYKKEYLTAKIESLMGQPYGRVVVMHIAIIFGAFLTISIGSPLGVL